MRIKFCGLETLSKIVSRNQRVAPLEIAKPLQTYGTFGSPLFPVTDEMKFNYVYARCHTRARTASVDKAMFAKLFYEVHQNNNRFVLTTRVTSYQDKFDFYDETKSRR